MLTVGFTIEVTGFSVGDASSATGGLASTALFPRNSLADDDHCSCSTKLFVSIDRFESLELLDERRTGKGDEKLFRTYRLDLGRRYREPSADRLACHRRETIPATYKRLPSGLIASALGPAAYSPMVAGT